MPSASAMAPRRFAVVVVLLLFSALPLIIERASALSSSKQNDVVVGVDADDLPAHFRPLNDTELVKEPARVRLTVDDLECQLPIRLSGGEWANDCLSWWDGQEWCLATSDQTWHVCKPAWMTASDRTLPYRSARVAGGTVGSLLESIGLPSEEKNGTLSIVEADFVPPVVPPPISKGPVVITEFMASNEKTLRDDEGSYPDWIEIQNVSPAEVNLKGWTLSNNASAPGKWAFPGDLVLPPREHLVVLASGKDRVAPAAPGQRGNLPMVHTNFKLKSEGGYLGLRDPSGAVASEYAAYPPQYEDVSFGKAGGKLGAFLTRTTNKATDEAVEEEEDYGYLQNPTPRMRNSFMRVKGPALFDVTENPKNRPNATKDFEVRATVYSGVGEAHQPLVTLYYKPGFLVDTSVPMRPTGEVTDYGGVVYSARIPGTVLGAGGMIRWYVSARSGNINVSRAPEVGGIGYPQYYGSVVNSGQEKRTDLPVMHFFSANQNAATSQKGGVVSVFYDNRFYDNVKTRRRGQTTITWDKPKLKVDFKGKVFKFADKERKVEEFNLQSHYFELGSQTYMREDLGSKVLLEAGVPTPIVFPLDLWMNGKFYGLYSFVEQIDDTFLKRNDLDTSGPLYKAWHQWKSNLRWDIETDDMQWAYRKGNLKEVKIHENRLGSYDDLKNFTLGLVGKGKRRDSWGRRNYVFQHVSIPEVINEMAAQNLIINQDRLTKNYYVYYDPQLEEWMRLPWDLEATFGLSPKLGGEASRLYCVLACEQFNSPLYGDSEHPQDIRDFYDGGRWNRRLQWLYIPPPPYYGAHVAAKEPQWVCENPGKDGTACFKDKSPRYADGTFNYLSDAILDVEETREMYLRRLRTLMDHFMNGRLEQIITDQYKEIRTSAKIDNSIWKRGDIDEGYEQLLTEQLPLRREQLYETYGPSGSRLIPGKQKENVRAEIKLVPRYGVIEIHNKEAEAIDVSGWKMDGTARFKFKPGTVIPSKSRLVLCQDVLKCKKNETYFQAHLLVQGPFKGSLPDQGGALSLEDTEGRVVHKI